MTTAATIYHLPDDGVARPPPRIRGFSRPPGEPQTPDKLNPVDDRKEGARARSLADHGFTTERAELRRHRSNAGRMEKPSAKQLLVGGLLNERRRGTGAAREEGRRGSSSGGARKVQQDIIHWSKNRARATATVIGRLGWIVVDARQEFRAASASGAG